MSSSPRWNFSATDPSKVDQGLRFGQAKGLRIEPEKANGLIDPLPSFGWPMARCDSTSFSMPTGSMTARWNRKRAATGQAASSARRPASPCPLSTHRRCPALPRQPGEPSGACPPTSNRHFLLTNRLGRRSWANDFQRPPRGELMRHSPGPRERDPRMHCLGAVLRSSPRGPAPHGSGPARRGLPRRWLRMPPAPDAAAGASYGASARGNRGWGNTPSELGGLVVLGRGLADRDPGERFVRNHKVGRLGPCFVGTAKVHDRGQPPVPSRFSSRDFQALTARPACKPSRNCRAATGKRCWYPTEVPGIGVSVPCKVIPPTTLRRSAIANGCAVEAWNAPGSRKALSGPPAPGLHAEPLARTSKYPLMQGILIHLN